MAQTDKRAIKAQSNRAQHQKLKATQEHLLLRVQRGERSAIDSGARACGLSRAAFAQLYLVPFATALTEERVAKLAALGASQRLGLAALFGRLIDRADLSSPADTPAAALSEEFDDLFGSGP